MEDSRLTGAMAGIVILPCSGILRMAGWLNGVAALLLTGIAVVSEDIGGTDLRWALMAFLTGVLACGLGGVFAYWGDTSERHRLLSNRPRRGHSLLASLAALACLFSLAAFAAGCWVTVGTEDGSASLNSTSVLEYRNLSDQSASI